MTIVNKKGEEVEMSLIKVDDIPENFDFSTCIHSMKITDLEAKKAAFKTAILSNMHPEKIDFYTDALVKIMTAVYTKTRCISLYETRELEDKSLAEARKFKPTVSHESGEPLKNMINAEIKARGANKDNQLLVSCIAYCEYLALYKYEMTLRASYSDNSYSIDNGPQKIIN